VGKRDRKGRKTKSGREGEKKLRNSGKIRKNVGRESWAQKKCFYEKKKGSTL